MTPAKFGEDSARRHQRSDSRSRHGDTGGLRAVDDDGTPLAGARRATAVDLDITRGMSSYAAARTPGNQYGRAIDLTDPFSQYTPRPYLNLEFSQPHPPPPPPSSSTGHFDLQNGGAATPMVAPELMDYPPSRDRHAMNLPTATDNILTETPSRFSYLPSLSRFTPFFTPKTRSRGLGDVDRDPEQVDLEREPEQVDLGREPEQVDLEQTPNIVATVKARRKSTTPRRKGLNSPAKGSRPSSAPKSHFGYAQHLVKLLWIVFVAVLRTLLTILYMPKHMADYVLSRSASKGLRTPRRSTASSSSKPSRFGLSLWPLLVATGLGLLVAVSLRYQSPDASPFTADKRPPSDTPSGADIAAIESRLASANKDTESILTGLGERMIRLQEFIDESAIRIKSLESIVASASNDAPRLSQLEAEWRAVVESIQQLQESQSSWELKSEQRARQAEERVVSKLEALKTTFARHDDLIGVVSGGQLKLRPEVINFMADRFALKGEAASGSPGLEMKIVEDLIESRLNASSRGVSKEQVLEMIEDTRNAAAGIDGAALKRDLTELVEAKV